MNPILSLTSDYFQSNGDPEPYLRRIAEAGFTHIHWCHHWYSDFLYSSHEVVQIARWMDEFGLAVLNIHASRGQEKDWGSLREYVRLSGVELVQNRIQMAADLHSEVVILHVPPSPDNDGSPDGKFASQLYRSMDALTGFARARGVRIALENMIGDDYIMLDALLSRHDPDILGFCYDSGHANMGPDGLGELERHKDRLIAVHLHDNDGHNDQHKIPFTGTIDWERMMRIISTSPYDAGINLEVVIRETGIQDEMEFLRRTLDAGRKLKQLVMQ
jgi:sugar phosphate isomerase/epimerase